MARARNQNGFVKPTGKSPRTWTGYWYEYEESDGKKVRRQKCTVLGKRSELTKGDAEKKLKELIEKRDAGETIKGGGETPAPKTDPKGQTFETAAARYLDLKSGDWSKKMRGNLASIFKNHINPAIGSRHVSDLKPSDIKAFYNRIAASGSESLVKTCVTYTRGVFEMLIDDEVLTVNPARKVAKPRKVRKPSSEFRTLEECARLLRAAEESPRDHVILRILLSCALRPSELFALRLNDVGLRRLRDDEAFVPVDGLKETKTVASDGFVPMSESLESELLAYIRAENINEQKEYLFPTEVGTAIDHDNYLDRVLKPIGERAGLRVNFQILRRTVATNLQNHGGPKSAQGLLRHDEVETTLKYYQQQLDENMIAAAESRDGAIEREVVELERLFALENK